VLRKPLTGTWANAALLAVWLAAWNKRRDASARPCGVNRPQPARCHSAGRSAAGHRARHTPATARCSLAAGVSASRVSSVTRLRPSCYSSGPSSREGWRSDGTVSATSHTHQVGWWQPAARSQRPWPNLWRIDSSHGARSTLRRRWAADAAISSPRPTAAAKAPASPPGCLGKLPPSSQRAGTESDAICFWRIISVLHERHHGSPRADLRIIRFADVALA
jgi:hypothetical protein